METDFLKLYINNNKTLVKTLVIKSQTSADAINDNLILLYGDSSVDLYDPLSWKYYLNIAGEYHTTDKVMTIISLDTLESIIFSKSNLTMHTATAKAYQYGTRFYYSLLSQYPDQEVLILGILYPSDINQAINADDGSILSYPTNLVEPQELTLINELEDFIKRYLVRWNVKAFSISDSLYSTAQHALLYLAILPKLLNLRLKRCLTNEAHSFHIQQFLASHSRLDRFMPYMTLKQILFLYRNIRYIERNSGKSEQFLNLVDHLLTERHIPLNEFSIRQLSEFDDKYYPSISVRRKALNPQFNIPEKDYFDIAELFTKEQPLVYGNADYLANNQNDIVKSLQLSNSSVIQSKDLESSLIDYNDSFPDTLIAVLLRQWAYMSQKGLYTTLINFKDPKTLLTKTITVEDSFIYMQYIFLRSIGIELTVMPEFINIKQRKLVLPTVDDLLSITSVGDLQSVAARLIAGQPPLTQLYTTNTFYNFCNMLYQEALYHWFLLSNTHDFNRRGEIANMIYKLYEDESILLTNSNTPIDQWLFDKNLPAYNYTQVQAQTLITDLFNQSTGLTVDNTKLLKNIQKALITVLTQLCSYSVQFITEINSSRIIPIPWAAIRAGNIVKTQQEEFFINDTIRTNDYVSSLSSNITIETDVNKGFHSYQDAQQMNLSVDTQLSAIHYYGIENSIAVYFKRLSVSSDNELDQNSNVIGQYIFDSLTPEQKQSLKSIYN